MNCPLNGQPCDHPKNIHVTEMINGHYNEMNLCQLCATKYMHQPPLPLMQQMGIMPPQMPQNQLGGEMEFLTNPKLILAAIFQNVSEARKLADNVKCNVCGITMLEIADSSRLGCPDCYKSFPQLIQVIKASQDGNVKHGGKRPKRQQAADSLEELKKNMDLAIKEEKYEEAAKLRDQIKQLESGQQ